MTSGSRPGPGTDEGAAGELSTARAALEALHEERRRLLDLVVRLPGLLAAHDPHRLVTGVAEACRELSGAQFAIYAPADGADEPVVTGVGWNDFTERPDIGQAPLLAGPRLHGQAHLVDDVAAWVRDECLSRAYGTLADGRLVRSWLIAPVRPADGDTVGVLYLGHPRPHVFTAEQQSLVVGCASTWARRWRAQRRPPSATTWRRPWRRPCSPRIPGVDAADRYRAAGAGEVGGDFYDVFPLEPGLRGQNAVAGAPGRWAAVLGDVSGSGPDAAAITGIARYSIRAIAPYEPGPVGVLGRLNEALLRQAVDDRFLTALLAYLRPGVDGVHVELASGGHPPALVLGNDESVRVLDRATGTLLGMLPDADVGGMEVTLGPGDALVLYTDGLVEARDTAGRPFGQDGLAAMLATCTGRSAAGIARRIEMAALGHCPELADDMAIVVIRATGRPDGPGSPPRR